MVSEAVRNKIAFAVVADDGRLFGPFDTAGEAAESAMSDWEGATHTAVKWHIVPLYLPMGKRPRAPVPRKPWPRPADSVGGWIE